MDTKDTTIQQLLAEGTPFLVNEVHDIIRGRRPFKIDGGAICICTSGEAEIAINTEKHNLSKGHQAIILDDFTLFIKRCSTDFHMSILIYSKEVAFQAMHKFSPSFFSSIIHQPIYRLSKESEKITLSYMEILKSLQFDTMNQYSTIMAINLLRCMMLNIYDKMKRFGNIKENMLQTRQDELFHKFMNLISKHGRRHREVAYYAEKLFISSRYLGEITKKIANESPKQTIDYHVISEIKLLLTFSEMSIQQIADYMHFPDQSYLGRYFKHHTGMSPMSYRTQELGR